jgi:hypothetical protein
MAFTDATNLEQVLGSQAQNKITGIQDASAQKRKRTVAQLAHTGNLMGGTADYPLADLASESAGAESDVYANLANALGSIPAEDWQNSRDYQRNLALTKLIGEMNKPSTLQEVMGGIRLASNIGATAAGAMA